MRNFLKAALTTGAFLAPLAVFAADLQSVFETFGELVSILTPVIVGLALLAFFWGLAMYVLNFGGEEKDKKKGRDMMIYGILVLFVIVSVWGLVRLLQNTFNIQSESTSQTVPTVSGLPRP